jgi:ABC-2 type transport system permease protein
MTAYLVADSATMFRRDLRRLRRYPSLTFFQAILPIVFLLLFVYVFGGTLGAGLGAVAGDARDRYIAYVVPGIIIMTIAGSATGTAIVVSMDMTTGLLARFRTMAIARASVLIGHVLGAVLQTLLAAILVVIVALLIGFRPTTGPVEWLGAVGLLLLATFAMTWLSVGMGLVANSVETASNLPLPLTLLPFLSSGFVPTGSLPSPLKVFADVQPFTPMIETMRGLLLGTPIGNSGWIAVAWCIGISVIGYIWALRLYDRVPTRPSPG